MPDPERLTQEEIAALRQLLVADSRRQWAISTVKGVAIWVASLSAGYLALKALAAEAIKGLVK